ncbi:MAG: chorismate mutase [Gammaproteobacteria bacterium]|nr:chorismate mutase [Gammaproteobacteria bacterium]MCY4269003.1 chorismate mutase [Gammaproteobacteria bacterium]MCY4297537.1 chorismate mutase [Gammaproteobacteria bacterium]
MSGTGDIPGELLAIRGRIDEIDRAIVDLLRERFALTHEVGLLKASRALEALDARREEEKLKALTDLSEANDLNPDLVRDLFRRIMEEVVSNHEKLRHPPR